MNAVYVVTINTGINSVDIVTYHETPTSVYEYISSKLNYYHIYNCLDHDKFCKVLEEAIFGYNLNSIGLNISKEKLQ